MAAVTGEEGGKGVGVGEAEGEGVGDGGLEGVGVGEGERKGTGDAQMDNCWTINYSQCFQVGILKLCWAGRTHRNLFIKEC